MAKILRQYFFCGGALIASRWVLTSAACMFNDPATGTQPYTADELKIVLGEHNTNSSSLSQIPRKVVAVSKIITHPSYSASTFNNDIALIQLSEEVDLNIYTPSCIAMTSENFEGQKAWVYGEKILILIKYINHFEGWGTTSFGGSTSDKLFEVEVPVVSNAVCNLAMSINVSFNHKILAYPN